jgi:hypothetical protein
MSVGAITTVWDWVNQLNVAAFAGHSDWRLATSAGSVGEPTGAPAELESILDTALGLCAGGSGPCISPIFGAPPGPQFWSASTRASIPNNAWSLSFTTGNPSAPAKTTSAFVRAVRATP